jgi:NAD(P)-dependent dehydrogenase (short-subunit alcohol dehydrogenase family)
MEELQTKTALVTGASKGIGRGIALELARRGCDVAVNYNSDEPGARQTVAEIGKLGRRAIAVRAHVGRASEVDALFEQVLAAFGRLSILVNNAGVQTWKPLLDLEEAEWDHVIDTNLKGTFLCTQRAGRHMKDHQWGRIINIGSGCNKVAFQPGELYGQQGRHRDVHQSGGGRAGALRHHGELRGAGGD